jgi:predicted RNase H-related nuclease YkuK (DUF458 family)
MEEESLKIKDWVFTSPTLGYLSFNEVVSTIINFMDESPKNKYKIIVGSDSQLKNKTADFVSVIAVHKVGKGGKYFWKRRNLVKKTDLRSRIYQEAIDSMNIAEHLINTLKTQLNHGKHLFKYNIEIHVDIGNGGPTREMINEIVGMIRGSGFDVKTKPEAYGAYVIADKYT